ncbi:rRNA cytosine-C5-methyltransferase [uncultured Bacteroides sp.]|uniref:methyltransferase RsmF C-terminal domain-like protein n=1 Tax=uncultured Bacteroides sp. TaxID=162156 RepID=UPI0026332A2A|nr:rRNA cytosine-C5-methyltransferase [uncultured Bacteroides sp.]
MELPVSFVDYTRSLLGDAEYGRLSEALSAEQPVSIRLNEAKYPVASSPLSGDGSCRVPWTSAGFYLSRRPTFTFDPLFHAGCYYVQEASSMFVEQALRQYMSTAPVVALDLCAAPGGKSTHVRSLLPEGSLLVANEVIRNRSQILAENLTKWGHPDVVVTNNDPADFAPLSAFFDVILTDVPCSGEGMFRKDPIAVSEWSPENVDVCWQRQRRILSDIWPCLKPGGLLVYSTCTYNTKEDEENIRWMRDTFGAEILPLDIPADWNITGNLLAGEDFSVYRFLPHRTRGEGFFLALLRKPEQEEEGLEENFQPSRRKSATSCGKKKQASAISKEQLAFVRRWLLSPDDYELSVVGTSVTAFPKAYLSELSSLQQSLRVIQSGVSLAEAKGKDLIPHHALAMSCLLCTDAFSREEVAYEQAIAYLRKEAIVLSAAAPRGYVLLTYKDVPLGFVKNIGNRANNLYPQEWRIRSGYLPEEVILPLG